MVELTGSDHWPFVGDVDGIVAEIEEFVTGGRAPHESETLLATVLFTDIVGSTERAAALGDTTWLSVLEEHDEIVRRQLAAQEAARSKISVTGSSRCSTGPQARCVATNVASEAAALGIRSGPACNRRMRAAGRRRRGSGRAHRGADRGAGRP